MHFAWRSFVGPGGDSTRTSLYFAPQLGQLNGSGEVLDIGQIAIQTRWPLRKMPRHMPGSRGGASQLKVAQP